MKADYSKLLKLLIDKKMTKTDLRNQTKPQTNKLLALDSL